MDAAMLAAMKLRELINDCNCHNEKVN
jgi:hypothetical protein